MELVPQSTVGLSRESAGGVDDRGDSAVTAEIPIPNRIRPTHSLDALRMYVTPLKNITVMTGIRIVGSLWERFNG